MSEWKPKSTSKKRKNAPPRHDEHTNPTVSQEFRVHAHMQEIRRSIKLLADIGEPTEEEMQGTQWQQERLVPYPLTQQVEGPDSPDSPDSGLSDFVGFPTSKLPEGTQVPIHNLVRLGSFRPILPSSTSSFSTTSKNFILFLP